MVWYFSDLVVIFIVKMCCSCNVECISNTINNIVFLNTNCSFFCCLRDFILDIPLKGWRGTKGFTTCTSEIFHQDSTFIQGNYVKEQQRMIPDTMGHFYFEQKSRHHFLWIIKTIFFLINRIIYMYVDRLMLSSLLCSQPLNLRKW